MKKEYPKFRYDGIKNLKISKRNKELIDKFLVVCGATAGKSKLQNIKRVMTKTAYVIEKDLDKLTYQELMEFLNIVKDSNLMPPTKNEIKKHLKRFIRQYYSNWSNKFKQLKDIRLEKDINQEKINSTNILREEDIERLAKGTDSIRWKTLIILMYETASRPEEILNTKWRNIDFNKQEIKLASSKTGNVRVLPIINTAPHLERLKEEYPYPDVQAEDYVFVSLQNRSKPIHNVTANDFFRNLGMRILGRPVWCYLFRHSKLTAMQKVLPGKIYEKFADHSLTTATRYSHLDSEDIRDALMKNVYKIKRLSQNEREALEKRIAELEKFYKSAKSFIDIVKEKAEESNKMWQPFYDGLKSIPPKEMAKINATISKAIEKHKNKLSPL